MEVQVERYIPTMISRRKKATSIAMKMMIRVSLERAIMVEIRQRDQVRMNRSRNGRRMS